MTRAWLASAAILAGGCQSAPRDRLGDVLAELRTDPNKDLNGVVVLRHGQRVAEAYFNGDDATTLHDIRSATKSITSLLMGIAIERGFVKSIDDSIATYLPEMPPAIKIRDLLTMRSGLDADDNNDASPGGEAHLDATATDWMRSVAAVAVKLPPGTAYNYASINAFLTGAIVETATKMHLDEFAKQNLFEPLGITRYEWRRVPIDRPTGQGNLKITTRDEAALGQLVLDHGRTIVSRAWIDQSIASTVPIAAVDPYADFYGFMWYTKTETIGGNPVVVHFASGNGGNKIYVVPSLDMVIAITSSAYNRPYGQRRSQSILRSILSL